MDMRVAAYAVIVDDDARVLLARWTEGRRVSWTMPGGGLEPGEDPEVAARREVQEETGYKVVLEELLGIHSRVIPARRRVTPGATEPLHTLRIVYRARIVGGQAAVREERFHRHGRLVPPGRDRGLQRVRLIDIALGMAGLTG